MEMANDSPKSSRNKFKISPGVFASVAFSLVLALGVAAGVYLVSRNQDIREKAASPRTPILSGSICTPEVTKRVTFESMPGYTNKESATVTNQYYADYGMTFSAGDLWAVKNGKSLGPCQEVGPLLISASSIKLGEPISINRFKDWGITSRPGTTSICSVKVDFAYPTKQASFDVIGLANQEAITIVSRDASGNTVTKEEFAKGSNETAHQYQPVEVFSATPFTQIEIIPSHLEERGGFNVYYDNFSYTYTCSEPLPATVTPTPTEPPVSTEPNCPLTATGNSILVNISTKIRADKGIDDSRVSTDVNIPAGTYKVTLASYDEHSVHGGQDQDNERYYVRLFDIDDKGVTQSRTSSDIPDDEDYITTVTDTGLQVTRDVTKLQAVHKAYPSTSPESLYPICMLLEPQN